ncbi:beta-glucosidase [Cladophialophora yegresii CBS 114405]|uniref:beta-glucosidase n=1 Tax=Cladophialophora yegresii CBS 114405 TaxID=1182544 RepID=W9WFF1_9EURO|nr:beta-glucosidase [Cladophialophora yegresii CBS 114405]EXJ63725.1 beta-glucosidase [Cladophialophora yegresii CBS 114405]
MVKDLAPKAALPADFLWGFATAAYQIEGGATADGRGPSIWDTFCKTPGKIADGSSGDVACDSYHRTAQDIALLKQTGAKAYRFSISWSRVIPKGGRNDPINQAGLDYYVKFVDDLVDAGIVPFVTLFHWDLPDELDKRYGGFLNKEEFVADYANYARVMFEALPKVKHWITFNEPFCSAVLGYNVGVFAPGRSSDRKRSPAGDSSTEPWIVGHSILIAHAHAVQIYRDEFKPRDHGEIGITLNGDWTEPWDPEDEQDRIACDRKIEFAISWFADPVYFGHYPESMVKQLGDRLPRFTADESELVKGSNDFYGMNHYCANYIRHKDGPADPNDTAGNLDVLMEDKYGNSIGPETQSPWLRPHAPGFRKLMKWLSDRYGRPKIYVTENGTSLKGENDLSMEDILEDDFRCEYFRSYITSMAEAVAEDGCDCRGYMAWSLMDNFEWAEGYETRFGVTYVDYNNDQKRYPKKSAVEMKKIFDQYIGKLEKLNGQPEVNGHAE